MTESLDNTKPLEETKVYKRDNSRARTPKKTITTEELEEIRKKLYETKNKMAALKLNSTTNNDWFSFYKSLRFFKSYKTSAELLSAFGKNLDPLNYNQGLSILAQDEDRVWFKDIECDVCAQNHVYERVLKEWSSISRGIFKPENIKETWESEKGPVTVTFIMYDETYRLRPEVDNDWLDFKIILQLNDILQKKQWLNILFRRNILRFEVIQTYSQNAFVTVLSSDEKEQMAKLGYIFST